MKNIFFCTFLYLVTNQIFAQEYFTQGKNRLNFAKTYFEVGGQYSTSFDGKRLTGNSTQTFQNASSIVPYLNIGGLHFWGHADFYISIPLAQYNFRKNDSTNFQFNQSVVTGARYLRLAYKDKKIRPYVGASWAVVNFKQEIKPNNNQPLFSVNKLLFDIGFLYGTNNLMARAGMNFYPSNQWNYPLASSLFQSIKTPSTNIYLGMVYAFESTRSKNMENENARLNKFPKVSSPTMNVIKNGDWFIGIGPSSSFMLSNSEYNHTKFPYFNKKPISNTFFDMALGYQFNKLGVVTALSFRNPTFTNEGFGTTQTIKKNSITLEVYKFLTDYSGFTPYIGLNLAYDHLNYSEKGQTSNFMLSSNKMSPGITFGWDILPGKTEQWFVLRTNLRWYPLTNMNISGKEFSLNQIEYNVIQAVFYPSRLRNIKNKRDK